MKTVLVFAQAFAGALLLSLASIGAFAQEAKKPMTVGDAIQVLGGLRNLDGQQVVVKQGGQDVVILQPWSFKNSALRLAIADNIALLGQLEASTEQTRQGIVKEILKGGAATIAPGSKEMEDFVKQYNDLLAVPYAKAPLLTPIDAKALNLDVNEIGVTTLSALSRILNR